MKRAVIFGKILNGSNIFVHSKDRSKIFNISHFLYTSKYRSIQTQSLLIDLRIKLLLDTQISHDRYCYLPLYRNI